MIYGVSLIEKNCIYNEEFWYIKGHKNIRHKKQFNATYFRTQYKISFRVVHVTNNY